MKKTVLLFLLVTGTIINCFSQETADYMAAKNQLIKTVDSLRQHKVADEYSGGWIAHLEIEFYLDTFYVEQLWRIELDYNGSTMGMVQANNLAELDYDSLLNKYYNKLYDRLQGTDKEKLKTSQRNWIKFRDSEKELNYTLYNEQYSDGGTIHKLFVSGKNTEITKQRVLELYHYLDRIWKDKNEK